MTLKKIIFILDRYSVKLLIAWIIILFILYSALSLVRHNNFQSGAFDLGIYDQAVWQYSRLVSPYNTIKERFILGDHLTLTLPFLAPLFYIADDVKILLIFQAFWITLSIFAVYKLTRLRRFSPHIALCISFVYSLFYGIQFIIFFDFHPVSLAVGAIPWMLYLFESRRKRAFLAALLFLLFTQENMGLALASLGLIYIFKKSYRKEGFYFIIGGLAISFTTVKIIGMFSPVGYEYWPEIILNPLTIILQFFDSQDKRLVWLYSASSFSFLPLLFPGTILAIALDLAQYFIPQKQYAHMITPFFHHRAILAPYLLLGLLEVLEFLRKKGLNLLFLSAILVLSTLLQQYIFHFPLNKLSKPAFLQSEAWMDNTRVLLARVPKETSIAAPQHIVPHLSHRKEIYVLWPRIHDFDKNSPCGRKSCWWLEFAGKPKYLVVNLSEKQTLTQLLETPQNFNEAIKNMEKVGEIKIEKRIGTAHLYRIDY